MSVAETVNVREFLQDDSPLTSANLDTVHKLVRGVQVSEFRQSALDAGQRLLDGGASEGALQRTGICCHVLAQHVMADRLLSQLTTDALGIFTHGSVLSTLGRHEESANRFEEAARRGYDSVDATLHQAGAIRAGGDVNAAEEKLRSIAKDAASRAEYSFQMGCVLADRGDTFGAHEYFERAVDMDPHHSKALFWLAAENSLRGNDEDAVRLYEQSLSKPPYYLGALLNLGLMYEDAENYQAARFCFRRVLEFDPNHERALLYMRDIEATSDMYYDEDNLRNEAKLQQLLGRPITDFELSVRSRNCLSGMNIYTLGDLTEISEQELLAGKNFGETSLQEIRAMMDSHNLRIGQNRHKAHREAALEQQNLSPQEQAMLARPVADLNLSVRAKKCMVRLGLQTLGQLIQRTPDELLASRNFGVTSLNEIRGKLSEISLKLRND